ncbi:MAG: GAF domain-containing protein, partial [Anaerolineae bacterium]|nr:GAF domain-containing protein [Anaerolineae bacterium]
PLDSDLKLARIAHQRAPHITNDLLGDPWIDNNEWVAETGMGAFAGYPLFAGDELVGVIGMFSYRSIEDEALPVLQSLALQVGTLVQNQQLFEQAARRAAEMQAVAEVGAEASASLDPEELLWTIAALTKDRFDLYHAHIYLFDEAAESLRLAAGAGNVGRAMVAAGHRISLGHERSLVARAARSREGVIVNNVTQAPDFLPNPMLPDTRSEMAIPMIVGDQMLGVLDVQSSQLDRFSDEDIQVMSVLAGQVAVAEQNAHLFSEAQQRLAIIESASNAIFLSNTGGELVYLNPYGLQWLGYDSLDEVLGKIMVELQAPDAERLQTEVASALRETGQWSGESVVVHKGGYVFPVEMTAFIIYDEDGNPEFYGSIMTDITERKAAEAELDSQRRTLEALLDNLPVGVFMAEVGTGLPLQVNNRALEMLGRGLAPDASADELAEVYAAFKYGTDEPYPSEQMPLVRGMQGEAAFVDDMEIHRPDDTNILLEVRGAPIFDASGEVTASVAVFTDITARYQAEQERIRLLTDLQQTGDALAERIKELAALQDVGAYGEENLALEEYLTRVANRIPDSMQFPDNCVSVIEYGGEVYGDARALNAPVSLVHDLEVGDEVYGRLVVGYTEEREFQTEEVPHLRDIAGRVSSYLENRQLFEQTQQALSETALLYNAGRRIVDASNIQSLVEVVATAVPIRAINRAVLFTLELDENGQLSTARSIGNWHSGVGEEPSEIGRMYEVGQVPTIALMATENAVFVNDVMHDERVEAGARAVFEMQQIASVAILPLWVGRRQVGTMLLETQEQHTFTPEEMRPFAALSGQMASALDSLLLLEQTQKRAAEMQAVSEVGAEAASSLNTDRLLKTVSELTKERFGLYHAHVYLLDDEERNLILRAGAGVAGDMMAQGGHHIPLSHQQSLVVQAALRRQPIIANNVTQASDFLPNPMLPQTKAELATPMIAGGEVIGVLDVQADQIDFFSQEDMQVQMTLASQVAVAVQNARLFSEQVAVAEQLREVDRLKSEFLASMSHELRTPLNSIIGYAEVLLDGIDGELTDDMEEDVGAIHGSGKHLLNLINDILDLAKIEAGQMDLVVEDFDLRPVAEDMANTNRILLKDKPVDIVLDIPDDLPQIHADSLRIRQVVSNLLTNAIKFTEEGSITLRARPFPADPKMVEIAIVDTGMGMNEKQLQVIFDRFRQVDQSHTRRAGGTGLGLSITRQLIEMHGGEIWVESEPDVGSTFAFTLPLATEGID